ncbi:MAG: GNAT family N-acetyltransferase [Pseudomonadota bacterium]
MIDPLQFPVPESFETARLLLRPFSVADAPQLHEALVESINELRENLWFLPWVSESQTILSAEARCRKAQGNFLLRVDLPYLAFERGSGLLVASAGLHRTDWSLPKTEVGYWVRTSQVGKGYASEAVNVLTEWALESLRAKRIELITDERNVGSRAVALRCGFRLEGVLHSTAQSLDRQLRNTCVYAKLPTVA